MERIYGQGQTLFRPNKSSLDTIEMMVSKSVSMYARLGPTFHNNHVLDPTEPRAIPHAPVHGG